MLQVTNKLLKRQLKKAGISLETAQPSMESFQKLLYLIEQSYNDDNDSRRTIEHSLDVLSHEMREVINELEQAHEEAKLKDQLMFQQAKFAQMGEMISMIAHQWRQPLNNISITAASMELNLLFNDTDNAKLLQHTHEIATYSQYLSDTIDDFRNFFKIDKSKEEVNFYILLKNVFNIIGESLQSNNIKIVQEYSYTKNFSAYLNELKHVIINILKNAEDALIENHIEDPYIKIKTYNKDNRAVLEISDNAGGISQENITKIFNPYFSTKNKKNGTGIGLYMSKIIIEEHCSGSLEAYNEKEGCLFRITLNT